MKIKIKDKNKWLRIWGFCKYEQKIKDAGWHKVGPVLVKVYKNGEK